MYRLTLGSNVLGQPSGPTEVDCSRKRGYIIPRMGRGIVPYVPKYLPMLCKLSFMLSSSTGATVDDFDTFGSHNCRFVDIIEPRRCVNERNCSADAHYFTGPFPGNLLKFAHSPRRKRRTPILIELELLRYGFWHFG